MKHISKLFIFFIAILPFLAVVFGGETMTECDDLKAEYDAAEKVYRDCTDPCESQCLQSDGSYDYTCVDNCLYEVCKTEREKEAKARTAYRNCYNHTLGITGPEFSTSPDAYDNWDNGTFTVMINFNYHGSGLRQQEQYFSCAGKITVNGGTIQNIQEKKHDYCMVYIKDITEDSITVNVAKGVASLGGISSEGGSQTYTKPGSGNNEGSGDVAGCCPAGYSESDGSCCNDDECTPAPSNCDKIKEMIEACPTIPTESIISESVDYIKINDGQCCFNGGSWLPQCECNNPPVNDTCDNGYVLDGACCIACDNPPQTDGQCESGYKLEGVCCIRDCSEGNTCKPGQKWSTGSCSCVCDPAQGCCGVQLNIPLPFIGDCIEMTTSNNIAGERDGSISINQLNAFPYLIQGIAKILVTLIMIFSIIIVIVAGLMMTTSVASESNYKKGLDMLQKVLVALILLGTSGLILKLINPNFFGG